MLYYSSFLILLPVFYGEGTLLGRLYTLLLGVSVLNHAKKYDVYPGKALVEIIDKVIVYTIACTEIYHAIIFSACNFRIMSIFWICFIYVVYNYHFKRRFILKMRHDDMENQLVITHVLFHIACNVGGLVIMYCLRHENV